MTTREDLMNERSCAKDELRVYVPLLERAIARGTKPELLTFLEKAIASARGVVAQMTSLLGES